MHTREVAKETDRLLGLLAQDSENPLLLADLAEAHLRAGEVEQALNRINQAIKISPDEPTILLRIGIINITAGDPVGAIATFEDLLARGFDSPALRFHYAYALSLQFKFERAKAILLENPHTIERIPQASSLLASLEHHLGDLDSAENQFRKFIEQHPESSEAYGGLALVLLDKGMPEEAEQITLRALEINPDNWQALVVNGNLALDRQDLEMASDYFSKAARANPGSGRAWLGQGLLSMMTSDPGESIENLQKAVSFMPDHIGTRHALAWAQMLDGRLADAEITLDQSLELNRNFSETHGGKAVLSILIGDEEAAEREAKIATKLDENSFSGRFARSLIAANRGNSQGAEVILKQLLKSQIGDHKISVEELTKKFLIQAKKIS